MRQPGAEEHQGKHRGRRLGRAPGGARVGEAREPKVEPRPLEVLLLRGRGVGGSFDLVARLVLRGLQLARRKRGGLQRGRHEATALSKRALVAVGAES